MRTVTCKCCNNDSCYTYMDLLYAEYKDNLRCPHCHCVLTHHMLYVDEPIVDKKKKKK